MSIEFNFKNTRQDKIPLSKIRVNADALRAVTDKDTPEYQQGLDSVRKRGIMNPILVREIKDPTTGEDLYGLIDGGHRFNWAMDAGLEVIPANIGDLAEADLLEAQILANVHKIETKPVQYTKAIIRVMGSNPTVTKSEMAARLSKDVKWLDERLGLLKLKANIQELVDNGSLSLLNAYQLSKLPEEVQEAQLTNAMTKTAAEFVPAARNLQLEIAKAKREGRAANVDVFTPTARLQKVSTIKEEMGAANMKPELSKVIAQAQANGVTTVGGAIAFALNWVMHMDPSSIAEDKKKWETDKATKEENAKKRTKEREEKKAEKAREKAREAGIPVA